MGKKIVVYKSNTGYTKCYADWIAKELGCESKESKKISTAELEAYDTIVYGGLVLAGKIGGIEIIKQNLDTWKAKQMIVFATGLAANEEAIQKVRKDNFTAEELKQISFYYFRGGLNYQKLHFVHKMMMKMMAAELKKQELKSEEDKEVLDAIQHSANFCKKEYIQPLVREIMGE